MTLTDWLIIVVIGLQFLESYNNARNLTVLRNEISELREALTRPRGT